MKKLILTGTPEEIIEAVTKEYPEIPGVLEAVRRQVPQLKREIAEYQAAVLYALAAQYRDRPNVCFLEIGTAWGYSAAILASAAPNAEITTLNPNSDEVPTARANLQGFSNVTVIEAKSWDYLREYQGRGFDLIFIDGDHKRVRLDLPWFEHLKPGGLFFFHDYSPAGTYRECPPVYEAVNELKPLLGKHFDALITDTGGVGMAGFYKDEAVNLQKAKANLTYHLAQCDLHSVLSHSHITALYELATRVKNVEGAIVEVGVGNGGSLAALAMGAGNHKKRQYIGYDSFQGIPQPTAPDGAKALWKFQQNPDGWCASDPVKVNEIFEAVKLPKGGLKIVSGNFADSLHGTNKIALLHIDATVYDSTKLALDRLYDSVVKGGIITVSAYGHWMGVKAAVDEFFKSRNLNPVTLCIDRVNIYWIKQ